MGVGCSDITPPPGVELGGYGIYRNRRNRGVHDRLYSRTLMLSDGETDVAIIVNDLLGVSAETLGRVRSAVGNELGLKEENVIVTATHTHSAPNTVPLLGWGEPDQDYLGSLPQKILRGAREARENMEKVRMGFARARVGRVSYNRVVAGGPVDGEVRVLCFMGESPVATLFNYSCHAVTIDVRTPDGFLVSADWPGYAIRFVEGRLGGRCLFLQGTCGDIDPRVAWHMRGVDAAEEVGIEVGRAVLEALRDVIPQPVQDFGVMRRVVDLPLQKFTEGRLVEEIADFLNSLERMGDEVTIKEIRPRARFYREYAEIMLEKIRSGLPRSIECEIHVVKVNDTALVFLPGEVFVEIGLEIMDRSPFENTMVIGYSGAYIGYIPTPLDYKMRAYASTMVPKITTNPPFVPEVGSVVIEEALRALKDLAG